MLYSSTYGCACTVTSKIKFHVQSCNRERERERGRERRDRKKGRKEGRKRERERERVTD